MDAEVWLRDDQRVELEAAAAAWHQEGFVVLPGIWMPLTLMRHAPIYQGFSLTFGVS